MNVVGNERRLIKDPYQIGSQVIRTAVMPENKLNQRQNFMVWMSLAVFFDNFLVC